MGNIYRIKKYIVTEMLLAFLLLCVSPCCVQAAENSAVLTVNENVITNANPSRLFGFNEDANWNRVGALAEGLSGRYSDEYYQMLREYGLNIPITRAFLHNLDWKETVGPLESRGADKTTGRVYTFGLVEWMQFTMKVTPDAAFVFTLNVEDDPDNLADFVRFLTLTPDDANAVGSDGINWAQRRVDYGIEKPINVAALELGNETDLDWIKYGSSNASGALTLSEAAQKYITLSEPILDAIKAVSDVPVSIISMSVPHESAYNSRRDWTAPVIAALGPKLGSTDYVTLHYYNSRTSNMGSRSEWRSGTDRRGQIIGEIEKLPAENRPKLYPSEHAVWLATSEATTDKRTYITDLEGTMATAELLNRFAKDSEVGLATYHTLIGSSSTPENFGGHCWGVVRPYTGGDYVMSSIGEYFKMAQDAAGDYAIDSKLTASGAAALNVEDSLISSSTQLITSSAFMTEDGCLRAILVNRNENTYNISLKSTADKKYKLEKTVTLTSADRNDENLADNPDKVCARTVICNEANEFSSYTVGAKSITVLYFTPLEGEHTSDVNADLRLNGKTEGADGSVPMIDERSFSVSAQLAANGDFAESQRAVLYVIAEENVTDEDIFSGVVWLEQSEIIRQRAYFDVAMPEEAPSGKYRLCLRNGSAAEEMTFLYQPSGKVCILSVNQSNGTPYNLEAALNGSNMFVTVKNISDSAANLIVFYAAYDADGMLVKASASPACVLEPTAERTVGIACTDFSETETAPALIRAFVWEIDTQVPLTDDYKIRR